MRIFVDIGAHYGETARIALAHDFDLVYSLEPSGFAFRQLAKIRDSRFRPEQIALSNRNGDAVLHGAGLIGASVYAEKKQPSDQSETIKLVRASDWFARLPEAQIFVKMNCEGSEADILEDLLDSGVIARIDRLFVDFDIRKVAGQEHRQAEIERRMTGVKYVTADGFGFGPQHGVEAWLEWHRVLRRRRIRLEPYEAAVAALKALLPRRAFFWLGRRFGRAARHS